MKQERWRLDRNGSTRTVLIYLLVGAVGLAFGYLASQEPSGVTKIYFVQDPSSPPDYEIRYSYSPDPSSASLVTQNVALIRERGDRDEVNAVYWSPKRPDEWGSVEMTFPWSSDSDFAIAILEPSLHLFRDYDATAAGELAIASEATGNRWITLAALGAGGKKIKIESGIDVTRWVRGSRSLRVRYRMRASRLMYHPTPNDPIGLAGAQCLRQFDLENGYSSRLRLWKDHPKGE